jgi:hypothetical protein
MKTNSDALLIGLCLAVCWAMLTIARVLLVPLLALPLTLAGWRPPLPAPAQTALLVAPAVPSTLAHLRVVELRRLARAQGLKALARSGRKADLLMALAA